VPGVGQVDPYNRLNLIPFDNLNGFFS
jgi:hypothetical protein